MLKLYTDESPGLKVDPVVVLVLSLGFIFSVVGLHGTSRLKPNGRRKRFGASINHWRRLCLRTMVDVQDSCLLRALRAKNWCQDCR